MAGLQVLLEYGNFRRMGDMRKITAILPVEILDGAVQASGQSLTETLRLALQDYTHRTASERLLAMRGKVSFAMDWRELRGKDEP